MTETTTPSREALARRVSALETQVAKLDRLVYTLFEQRKRMPFPRTAGGASDQ
jgi:hypothetical protein